MSAGWQDLASKDLCLDGVSSSPPATTLLSERGEQLLVPKMRVLWHSGSVRCRVYFSMSNVKRIHPKSVRAESET